jgi:hypothetical protein
MNTHATIVRCFFIVSLLTEALTLISQKKDLQREYFSLANECSKKGEFRKADSLFTLSIGIHPDARIYFNRALCRAQLGMQKEFCLDLDSAYNLGDNEARRVFWEKCGRRDTIYVDGQNKLVKKGDHAFKEVYESYPCISHYNFQRFNLKNELVISYFISGTDTIFGGGKHFESPQFPGGLDKFMNYFTKNYHIPQIALDAGIGGKCYMAFDVYKDGSIKNVKIMKGIPGCRECDLNAKKMLEAMPNWSAGLYYGKPVNSRMNLPINVKVDRK